MHSTHSPSKILAWTVQHIAHEVLGHLPHNNTANWCFKSNCIIQDVQQISSIKQYYVISQCIFTNDIKPRYGYMVLKKRLKAHTHTEF